MTFDHWIPAALGIECWQALPYRQSVSVADVAVTATLLSQEPVMGKAIAMGEANSNSHLPHRICTYECCRVDHQLGRGRHPRGLKACRIVGKLDGSWHPPGEGAALYEAVEAIGIDICLKLGVSIPVGKDSMSMEMKRKSDGYDKEVTAPESLGGCTGITRYHFLCGY